jgi:hypothetical protein
VCLHSCGQRSLATHTAFGKQLSTDYQRCPTSTTTLCPVRLHLATPSCHTALEEQTVDRRVFDWTKQDSSTIERFAAVAENGSVPLRFDAQYLGQRQPIEHRNHFSEFTSTLPRAPASVVTGESRIHDQDQHLSRGFSAKPAPPKPSDRNLP